MDLGNLIFSVKTAVCGKQHPLNRMVLTVQNIFLQKAGTTLPVA